MIIHVNDDACTVINDEGRTPNNSHVINCRVSVVLVRVEDQIVVYSRSSIHPSIHHLPTSRRHYCIRKYCYPHHPDNYYPPAAAVLLKKKKKSSCQHW